MKKIYGFAALVAAMTLASCSNEDQPQVVDEAGATVGYIAVSIAGDGTRADANAISGADESKVASATFVFYNGSTYVTHRTLNTADLDASFEDGTGNVVDRVASTLVTVDKKDMASTPDHMVTILNAPADLVASDEDMETLLGKVQDFQTGLTGTGGKFVMSNSVYQENSTTVDVTNITGKLYETPELAKKYPVQVYVERVVARADIKNNLSATSYDISSDESKKTITYMKDDGTIGQVTPKIVVKGVTFANRANTSRLVKSIAFTTEPSWTWKDTYRSHWAVSSAKAASDFSNSSYTSITDKTSRSVYLQENTSDIYTSVLLTAQLQDGNGQPLKLVRLMSGGTYFLEEGAKALLVQQLVGKYGYVTGSYTEGTEVSSLPASFFEWKEGAKYTDNKTYDCVGYLQLITKAGSAAANATIMVKKDGKWANATDDDKKALNELLASTENQALVWSNGACYYYVDIKNKDEAKGIVRNHVYDLDLKTIAGLGVPVVNPDKEIIPGTIPTPTSSEQWNLGAVINVVKWALIHQDIDFSNN
ncbi:MAG: fimbria major subunit [Muribaculaceae bacterium]|nr:fimbria major subunit [Muribaculaceae bacterium]